MIVGYCENCEALILGLNIVYDSEFWMVSFCLEHELMKYAR